MHSLIIKDFFKEVGLMSKKKKFLEKNFLSKVFTMIPVLVFLILIIATFLIVPITMYTIEHNERDIINLIETEFLQPKIEHIKDSGKLVLGTSTGFPPYVFHLLSDNQQEQDIVGLDIDIAKEIAKELGVRLEIKNIAFHNLFNALNTGEVDLVMAGLSPSERRKKFVDFSEIYYQVIQNIVIRSEDIENIVYLKDLRGKKVGVKKGSIQEEMAQKEIVGATIVPKSSIIALIFELRCNKIDAIILEKPVAESYVNSNFGLKNIECHSGAFDVVLGSAVAVKKGNWDLLNEINMIIGKLKKGNMIYEFVEDVKILISRH
jgi:polar amino acid transport system substrate-binding protein